MTCLSVLDHSAAAHRPRLPSSPHASPTPGSGPPCLLYIHGGGFIGSSFANDARLVVEWAKATGMMVRQPPAAASPGAVAVARLGTARTLTHVCLCAWFLCAREQVVFIHYSLAPEHRFPVALNECMRVYGWLRCRCSKVRRPPTQPVTHLHTRRNGGSCDPIASVYLAHLHLLWQVVVFGESAGGNLAVASCIKGHRHGVPPRTYSSAVRVDGTPMAMPTPPTVPPPPDAPTIPCVPAATSRRPGARLPSVEPELNAEPQPLLPLVGPPCAYRYVCSAA